MLKSHNTLKRKNVSTIHRFGFVISTRTLTLSQTPSLPATWLPHVPNAQAEGDQRVHTQAPAAQVVRAFCVLARSPVCIGRIISTLFLYLFFIVDIALMIFPTSVIKIIIGLWIFLPQYHVRLYPAFFVCNFPFRAKSSYLTFSPISSSALSCSCAACATVSPSSF